MKQPFLSILLVGMLVSILIAYALSQYELSRMVANLLIVTLLVRIVIELESIGKHLELFLKWYSEKK